MELQEVVSTIDLKNASINNSLMRLNVHDINHESAHFTKGIDSTLLTTQGDTRSCSPRDKLSYKSDRRAIKLNERFEESGQLVALQRLIWLFELAVTKEKPDNIVDFAVDDFFSRGNAVQLRQALAECDS